MIEERSTRGSLRAAAELAWAADRRLVLRHLGLSVLGAALPVAVAWLTKIVLDRVAAPGQAVLLPVLLLALAGVAASFVPQANQFLQEDLRRTIDLTARGRLYHAVARMAGLRRFEDPRFHDRMTLAGEAGPSGPSEVVGGGLAAAQGALSLGGFVGTIVLLNPWMLLPVLGVAVIALAGQVRLGRFRVRTISGLGHATRRELFYATLMTGVSAAKEVRLFGLGDLFGLRMLAELRAINDGHRDVARRELVVQGLHGAVGAAIAGAGLVWAVGAAGSGALTVGDVSLFILAVAGVQNGLTAAIHGIGRVHEAMLMFEHYRFVVGAGPDLPEAATPREVPRLRHGIELRDVWFRYADDLPWVLRGVNLTIPAGVATALVGPNGGGKSTLVKLLCRFYDPTRGAVLWDGADLRELPVAQLRRRLGCVFQDFVAYDLSAAENIGVGDVTALDDRSRIEAAAERAGNASTLARLPLGYDTMLSRMFDPAERDDPTAGVLLSGGQWQRVAIARALMREDPELIILDEPSSGLDAEAEHEVHQRLRDLRVGRTSLLISHRLSAVRDAESIVVVADGEVAEHGRHDELLAAGGRYARLFRLQAAGYRDEALT